MPPVPPLSEKPCVLDVGMKSVRYGTVQYRKESCVQVSELEGTEELRVGIGIFEKEREEKEREEKEKEKEEEEERACCQQKSTSSGSGSCSGNDNDNGIGIGGAKLSAARTRLTYRAALSRQRVVGNLLEV